MQDYIDFAEKNGVILNDSGECQFCGAKTTRGVHECLEIFNFSLGGIDFTSHDNLVYKFLIVDSHTLQHPEIHGRWNNHFHLARLTLILKFNTRWTYGMSSKLSDVLKEYKQNHAADFFIPPMPKQRGKITTSEIKSVEASIEECKNLIRKWAEEVYHSWKDYHKTATYIAERFRGEKL